MGRRRERLARLDGWHCSRQDSVGFEAGSEKAEVSGGEFDVGEGCRRQVEGALYEAASTLVREKRGGELG